MKNVKTILCLISLFVAGITNVWGEVNIGDEYSWNSTTKTLTIHKAGDFASGETTDFTDVTKRAWKDVITSAQHLIVEDGITHLGAYTFYRCSVAVDVKLPASLVSVGHAAFFDSKVLSKIYFEGTPNQWASIDFRTTDDYNRSHPFYDSNASARNFYFYGGSTVTAVIVLTPGITTVKPFAFYNATGIQGINIPGSVTTIGTNAFNVSSYSSAWVAINKKTAPSTVGTNAFNTSVALYIPTGNSGYGVTPWTSFSSKNTQSVGGDCGTPTAANVKWQLSEDGVLTLTGHGDVSIGTSGPGLSFARFRRLVKKLVVNNDGTGYISSLGHAIHWCYGISEVTINQLTIPTSENIATDNATNFAYLFNPNDNVVMNIKAASLTDGTVTNLGSAPWNSAKLDIALSDDVTVNEVDYNAGTMLRNIHKYIEKNINLKLDRADMKNTYFNTFCSPIPLSAEEVSNIFGEADIRTLTSSSYDEESQTLTLNFSDPATPITTIDSGVPYLIQPEKEVDFSTITFENLAPSKVVTSAKKVTGEHVNFYGTLGKVDVTEGQIDNASFLFLLADNKLTYATEGSLKGMRAYFILNPSVPAGALAHRPVLNFDDEQTPTAIDKTQTEVKAEKVMENGVMYIIKNGVKYSVMGERVR